MKKTLKLIPAIAMLLISAVLVSTSTYAWFTMNKTVTATGMKVQARAEGGIVISRKDYNRDTATDTASYTISDGVKLLPTSTSAAGVWFHAEAASADDEVAQAGTMKTLTLSNTTPSSSGFGKKTVTIGENENVYVLYDTYTVYPDKNSASFTDLWVSACTVDSATKDLSKSLRVAVVCGNNVVICAPVSGATLDYTVGINADGATSAGTAVKAVDTSTTGTTLLAKATSGDNAKNILVADGTVTGTSGVEVSVYVYFEGEDGNHFTNNLNVAGAAEAITVTVKFSCTSVAAQ